MKVRKIGVAIFMVISFQMFAQSYFKVEFDAFSPPVKAMIDHIEGKPAKNFLMKDLSGQEVMLSHFLGKKVVLWFWENNEESKAVNEIMSIYFQKYPQTAFVSLFNGTKQEMTNNNWTYPFTVLPNAAFLGEAVYDKELGSPRIYLVSEAGIVKMVLPQSYLSKMEEVQVIINNFITDKLY